MLYTPKHSIPNKGHLGEELRAFPTRNCHSLSCQNSKSVTRTTYLPSVADRRVLLDRVSLTPCVLSAQCSPALLSPTGRFVPGPMLTPPHCVSHTVIHGHGLRSQVVHLQVELILGIVSGDGQSAFYRVGIICGISISIYSTNPHQPLP